MSETDHKDVKSDDLFNPNLCPIRQVLGNIGDKWSLLVLLSLQERGYRFGELQREIADVSHKVLTDTLRKLERDGFVLREDNRTFPPKVDYSLTSLGQDILLPLVGLADWGAKNLPKVKAARERFDNREDE